MVALIGRRRVGKTFLVRSVYAKHIRFEVTGLQNSSTVKAQLNNFFLHLKKSFGVNAPTQKLTDWLDAFYQLTECLDKTMVENEKTVVFLDELPWLATRKSGFLDGLSFFWNSWAVQKNVVVVICGSAASWMIQNVVNNKGGLYNRITRRIYLLPFNLYETDEYSLFYLHFMEKNLTPQKNKWQELSQTQEYKSWCGYAFENLCLKHSEQIKKGLGISGIYSESSSFYHKGNAAQQGVQIDLIIDRKDNVINLFELKFYAEPFLINKNYANELREKVGAFKTLTGTRKQVFLSLLSSYSLKHNEHSLGLITSAMAIDVLFEKV
jgi:AAA+ ATPase superfamily predicted ATPase